MNISDEGNRHADFIEYLMVYHKGRKKAVTSRRLEAVFNIKGSEIRRIVNEARSSGYPICSDNCGYYYAGNKKELNATIAQLSGRVDNISNARDGLLSAIAARRAGRMRL